MGLRQFIGKASILGALLAATYLLAAWQLSKGSVDFFYPKFTHRAGSMIIGISRVGIGIAPSVIAENFGGEGIASPVLNFAFSHRRSDYGEVYLEAIKKKILPDIKNGLFILEVSPAGLSILKSKKDSSGYVTDDHSILAEVRSFNSDPNFHYIRQFYGKALYKGFYPNDDPREIRKIHPDGWIEILAKTDHYEVTEEEMAGWKRNKLEEARQEIKHFKPSRYRISYLEKTIAFLQDYGKVYLVRMPVDRDFLELEESFWPGFSEEMSAIARKYQVPFLDYSADGDQYRIYDGSHLLGPSAVAFTRTLCADIKSH